MNENNAAASLHHTCDVEDGGHSRRDEAFMRLALAEAAKAEALGEVPVGAVVVVGQEVIATGHDERETRADPAAHADRQL